jgi:hypothetical protein
MQSYGPRQPQQLGQPYITVHSLCAQRHCFYDHFQYARRFCQRISCIYLERSGRVSVISLVEAGMRLGTRR